MFRNIFFSRVAAAVIFFSRGENRKQQQQNARQFFFSSFCDSFTTTMVVYDAEELDRFCCWANCVSSMCVLMMMLLLLLLCTAIFLPLFSMTTLFYCRVICMMRFRCLHIKWMEMMNFLSFSDEGLLGMFWRVFFCVGFSMKKLENDHYAGFCSIFYEGLKLME